MKGITTIIAIVCVAVCLLGWLSFVVDKTTASSEQKNYIEQADAWVEDGLYQRAIKHYKKAQQTENDLELAYKLANAYALRYEEASEETYDEYVEALEGLLGSFPGNEEFTIALTSLYFVEEDYTEAYAYLKTAVDMGSQSDTIKEMLQKARYAYRIGMASYTDVKEYTGNAYTVAREGKWGVLDVEDGLIHMCEYVFAGQTNSEGVFLFTDEKDSRLIDGEGMILGIFDEKITDAGMYADGLIAASNGKEYHYYDEFAVKMFGGYEMAGTFCDGKAAVKQNGKWLLVNKNGESVSDSYAHIVLNACGEYICNGKILAADSQGSYKVYDKDFKELAGLAFDDVGVLTDDGIIAVAKNGKWGFANTKGEIVIEPQYERAHSFSNGLAAICQGGLWGFIDKNNEVVIPCQFTEVTLFNEEGSCMVRVDIPEVDDESNSMENTENIDESVTEEKTAQTIPEETTEGASEETTGETVEETVSGFAEYQEEWKMLELYNGIVED